MLDNIKNKFDMTEEQKNELKKKAFDAYVKSKEDNIPFYISILSFTGKWMEGTMVIVSNNPKAVLSVAKQHIYNDDTLDERTKKRAVDSLIVQGNIPVKRGEIPVVFYDNGDY